MATAAEEELRKKVGGARAGVGGSNPNFTMPRDIPEYRAQPALGGPAPGTALQVIQRPNFTMPGESGVIGATPAGRRFDTSGASDVSARQPLSAEAAYGERVNPTPKPAPASNYVSPGVGGRDPFSPGATSSTTAPGAADALARARAATASAGQGLSQFTGGQPSALGGRIAGGVKSLATGAGRLAGRLATPVAVGLEGYDVAKVAADPTSSGVDVATQATQGAGRLGAAGIGAGIGAKWGAKGGPLGIAAGGLIGGSLGYFGANEAIKAGRSLAGTETMAPADRIAATESAQAKLAPTAPAAPFKDPRILGNTGTIAEQLATTTPQPTVAPSPAEPQPNQISVTRQPNGVLAFSGKDIAGEPSYTGGAGFKPGGFGVTSLGGPIAPSAASQAALTNPDGSRWTAQDSAVMAANLRDNIDPYRGTSRQTGQALTDMGGSKGGFGILGNDYQERRSAGFALDSITATKAQKAAAAQALQGIDARKLQGAKESGDTARATMADSTARRGQEVASASSKAANELARQRVGFEGQQVALAGQKLAGDQQVQGFGIRAAAQLEEMQKAFRDAKPEDRPALAEQIRVLSGRDKQPDNRFLVVPGGQVIDPTTGATVNQASRVFNTQTERLIGQDSSTPQATPSGLVVGAPTKQADGTYSAGDKMVTIKSGKVVEIK